MCEEKKIHSFIFFFLKGKEKLRPELEPFPAAEYRGSKTGLERSDPRDNFSALTPTPSCKATLDEQLSHHLMHGPHDTAEAPRGSRAVGTPIIWHLLCVKCTQNANCSY